MTESPKLEDPDGAWPTREEATFVPTRETFTPAPLPPEPAGPPPDRRIGTGMLLGLGVLALVAAGLVAAYLLTHRDSAGTTTTVVVTSHPAAVANATPTVTTTPARTATSHRRTTTGATTTSAATTTARTTTDATTTVQSVTTTAAPPTPANATVPDVSGASEQAAAAHLAGAGILPSIVFVPAQDPLGTVERQAKAAGTVVPYRSHVQINVSKGPHATSDVTVPNTIGRTLSEAVSTLNAAELRLIYVKLPITSRAQAGTIVQQSPLAGGTAPRNGQVLVFLGAYRSR